MSYAGVDICTLGLGCQLPHDWVIGSHNHKVNGRDDQDWEHLRRQFYSLFMMMEFQ